MSHFYGTLQGGRGETTRGGTKSSGLETYTASYAGAVRVKAYVKDGVDYALVQLAKWEGMGIHAVLYDGPIGGPHAPTELDQALRCRTCLHFRHWESFVNGECPPNNEENSDESQAI